MKVYGRRSVIEAIKSDLEIQKAFIKKNAINMEEIVFKLKKKNIPISFVPIEKLKKLTNNNNLQSLFAVNIEKYKYEFNIYLQGDKETIFFNV